MKSLITLAIVVIMLALSACAQSPPPNGITLYGVNSTTVPSGMQPSFDAWLFGNFKLVIGGGIDMSAYRGPNNGWTTYVDTEIYLPAIYKHVLGTAATQGWADPEGPLLHMITDYSTTTPFSGIDQFDAYEQDRITGQGNPVWAVRGVFTLVGSTYTDVTVRAYCPTTVPLGGGPCGSYTPNPITVSDRLLIGYQVPFDTVNFTVNTGRSGGAVTYQYWNGSAFATLTPASDTTSGLTTTGTVTFLPPLDWVPSVKNGSQSKYWVQVTVSGAGKSHNPIIGKVYGDNLLTSCSVGTGHCNRGWKPSACLSGHINAGTPVEYCGTPAAGSTARFRQQARTLGYGVYNDFFPNPANTQGGQITWAYVQAERTAAQLALIGFTGLNGVIIDDSGSPPQGQTPTFVSTNSELGSTTFTAASATELASLHVLLTATHGSSPTWYDGQNTNASVTYQPVAAAMNYAESEAGNQVESSYSLLTDMPLFMCTDSAWCPGTSTSHNPNHTLWWMKTLNNSEFGLWDHNGTALANYHSWDMAQRGPSNALAMFHLIKNPNILMGYNPAGFVYVGYDDYYVWVTSARTLAAPITASTCSGTCSISLSGALETSTCPGTLTQACPIRIGGANGDIVGTTSYSGTMLTTKSVSSSQALLNSYSAGASIEYAVLRHQSQDIPLHSPIMQYGYFFPAMSVYLGTPDATYGFDHPCTGNGVIVTGGCIAATGPAISGNPAACATGNHCSPLLRRDFTGGTYGDAIVLLRPSTIYNTRTASTEYDTYSVSYSLPGTYYQLMADGTVSSTPLTSVTLRGGEAGIYVSSGS